VKHPIARFIVLSFAFIGTAAAQTPVGPGKKLAIHAPRPEYPLKLRSLEGRGVFMMNVRPDGTVESVDIMKSTGHSELDQLGVAAFLKWRFRPGNVTKVKIPLEFRMAGLRQRAQKHSSPQ
jgi:TonB family protein